VIAERLVAFLDAAHRTLDIAIYDVRLPGPVGDRVADAIRAAAARGVQVRIAFNQDEPAEPLPPPPRTEVPILETLGVPLKAISGRFDLMHHKFVVRDGNAVWTGSTNWTLDSWTREENVLVTVDSADVARAYTTVFDHIWRKGDVENSGKFDTHSVGAGRDVTVRPWFCPGRAEKLTHRISEAIGCAERRVRIASPVLTSAPILATLAQLVVDGKRDIAGVVDATQVSQVIHQWEANGNVTWKRPLLDKVLASGRFTGKRSTPWAPGAIHDYMHAKISVCDDTVFVGSFNLSRSGEENGENVLEIADRAIADQAAAFIDGVRAKYPSLDGAVHVR
jgi:phosphatidylserine/phosphatidylglycerophosphate/cardiolipin synthase-like enzyme